MKTILQKQPFWVGEPGGHLSRGETFDKERRPLIPVSNGEVLVKKAKQKRNSPKSEEISCHAPGAGSVFLAGTLNAWDRSACPMKRVAEGIWRVSLRLDPALSGDRRPALPSNCEQMCRPVKARIGRGSLGISWFRRASHD